MVHLLYINKVCDSLSVCIVEFLTVSGSALFHSALSVIGWFMISWSTGVRDSLRLLVKFLAFSGWLSVCPCSYSSILSIIFRSLNCLQTRLTPACLWLASSCGRLCVQGGLSASVNKTKNPAEKHISMKIELTGLVVC